MTWIDDTKRALRYIENHLLDDLNIDDVATHICASSSNFGRIFYIVTGFSVTEYVRMRRLSKAGQELRDANCKVVDIALKYGYESSESFSKAFTHFHGITPSEAKNTAKSLKIFAPLTIEINIKGGCVMTRKLISNVEKIYEDPTENYMFPSCMRSVMGALGEDKTFDFMFFTGATGDLFTQTWMNPKWQYNDSFSNTCHHTLVPIKNAFAACGYDYEYISKSEIQKDKAKYTQKIVESIDRGVPVLTFGIVGPPVCSIIFGYDENGDVLIGWSQFADEPSSDTDTPYADNYFQKRNGLDNSDALIFIGEKRYTPSIADGIRNSIRNIPMFADLADADGLYSQQIVFGKRAFEAWADSLLDDSCFKNEDMLASPMDTYGSCVIQIGTNMHYIESYLDRAFELCPDISILIDNLRKAYKKVADALEKVTDFQGGYFFDADRNVLLSRDYRVKLAALVRELGDFYINVADEVKSYDFMN